MIESTGDESAGRGAGTRWRRILFFAIGLLYIASVPWYRTTGGEFALVLGLPDWVAVSLGCYLGVAVLNAVAWQLTEIEDPAEEEPDEDPVASSPSHGDVSR